MIKFLPHYSNYYMKHAMNCKRGGFLVMRHNNVRDFEANILKTIQNDVKVELALNNRRTYKG